MRLRMFLSLFAGAICAGQVAQEGAAGDAQKVVTIRRIEAEGTRLPATSVIRLAQIKPGDQVNFIKLHGAMQKVTQSGLIATIAFEYESVPEKESDVVLHLKCVDVKASARAVIQIPGVNEDDVWAWLGQVDPLFTREMPANEAAIRLYSLWIGKYLEAHGEPNFRESRAVKADGTSSTGGGVPDVLTFKIVKLRGVK